MLQVSAACHDHAHPSMSHRQWALQTHYELHRQIVSALPALTKLVLLGAYTANAELLPSCTEIAAFRSPTLRQLCIGMTPERLPVAQEVCSNANGPSHLHQCFTQ